MNMQNENGPTATLEDLYDPNFREMVRDNDPNALAALGLSAQDGEMPEVRVVTDRPDTLHLSLPRELPESLSAADLEGITGGYRFPTQEEVRAHIDRYGFNFPGAHDHWSGKPGGHHGGGYSSGP